LKPIQDLTQNQPDSTDKTRAHRGEFVVAPLAISSPALGTGIVSVAGYIFPISTRDKTSPPSTIWRRRTATLKPFVNTHPPHHQRISLHCYELCEF
jgi:hypothetical protein